MIVAIVSFIVAGNNGQIGYYMSGIVCTVGTILCCLLWCFCLKYEMEEVDPVTDYSAEEVANKESNTDNHDSESG